MQGKVLCYNAIIMTIKKDESDHDFLLRIASIGGCVAFGLLWLQITGPVAVLRITTVLKQEAPFWYMISAFPVLGMLVADFLKLIRKKATPDAIELAVQMVLIVAISNARLGLHLPISGHFLVLSFFMTRRLQNNETRGSHALEFTYCVLTFSALSYVKLIWWTDPVTLSCGAILGLGMALFGKQMLRKNRQILNKYGASVVRTVRTCWRVLLVGGWAPLIVFATHLFADRVFNLYEIWPAFDVPMHFAGGISIAFFISRCFQTLPRDVVPRSRRIVLELLLAGTLTVTAAVFWEFAEFTLDQLFGSNIQISLENTMKDLAVGTCGAVAFIIVRARQLQAGTSELREVTNDWIQGQAA